MRRLGAGGVAILLSSVLLAGCNPEGQGEGAEGASAGGSTVTPMAQALRIKEIVGPCDIAGQEVGTAANRGDVPAVQNAGRTGAVTCTAAVEQLGALAPQGADAAATAKMLAARDVCRSAYQTRVRALELIGAVDASGNTPAGTEEAGAQWQAGLQACQTALNGLTGETAAAQAPAAASSAVPASSSASSDTVGLQPRLERAVARCSRGYGEVTEMIGQAETFNDFRADPRSASLLKDTEADCEIGRLDLNVLTAASGPEQQQLASCRTAVTSTEQAMAMLQGDAWMSDTSQLTTLINAAKAAAQGCPGFRLPG